MIAPQFGGRRGGGHVDVSVFCCSSLLSPVDTLGRLNPPPLLGNEYGCVGQFHPHPVFLIHADISPAADIWGVFRSSGCLVFKIGPI